MSRDFFSEGKRHILTKEDLPELLAAQKRGCKDGGGFTMYLTAAIPSLSLITAPMAGACIGSMPMRAISSLRPNGRGIRATSSSFTTSGACFNDTLPNVVRNTVHDASRGRRPRPERCSEQRLGDIVACRTPFRRFRSRLGCACPRRCSGRASWHLRRSSGWPPPRPSPVLEAHFGQGEAWEPVPAIPILEQGNMRPAGASRSAWAFRSCRSASYRAFATPTDHHRRLRGSPSPRRAPTRLLGVRHDAIAPVPMVRHMPQAMPVEASCACPSRCSAEAIATGLQSRKPSVGEVST